MPTLDLTPLFRSSVGFEHMMNLVESLSHNDSHSYPPYDIEKLDDANYKIKMAVAGFDEDNLSISLQENTLIITGENNTADQNIEYLYKGIAQRGFERHFQLADFIEVGAASLENGLLSISLLRKVPEPTKIKKIAIESKNNKGTKRIEQK